MSPRKVNKDEKRREIALKCSDLFREVGVKRITVAEVAKKAGIGKGTVYEYFENKEDIIFEIINIDIEQYHNNFLQKVKGVNSTKEKIYIFFDFVLSNTEENLKQFNAYKEYLGIMLSDENENMCNFNGKCNAFFMGQMKKIIQEGIDSGELVPEAIILSEGLLIFEKGLALIKMTDPSVDVKAECEKFLENFIPLIKAKK